MRLIRFLPYLRGRPRWPAFVHWKVEQLGVTTKPSHDRRAFGQQSTHQCLARIRAVEHHNEASLATERTQRPHYLPAKIQSELMFRAEFPVVTGCQRINDNFSNILPREQRQSNYAKHRMREHHP